MRVLICGSRNWKDYKAIEILITGFSKDTVIIQGMCRGADRIAKNVALKHGMAVEDYPAEWEKYGKSAGPIRNKRMLEEGKPDLVYAFLLSQSRGTEDMIARARTSKIPVIIMGTTGETLGDIPRRNEL